MHRDADKHQKEGGLSHGLKTNASIKGFEIVHNDGKGNCMFHALCDQLKYKKHLEISHQDLRKDLVKYLHGHPKLVSFSKLKVKDHSVYHVHHQTLYGSVSSITEFDNELMQLG